MLAKSCDIADTIVGIEQKPYIIAEIGSNFNQSLDTAKRLIDAAASAGANAVKFQLFRADILYPNKAGLYELFKSIELNVNWLPQIKEHSDSVGIHFTASAFDFDSISALENVNVPFHKIASSETTNLPLLHSVVRTGKPVMISTGMCDMVDVEEAVKVSRALGNEKIILMQCGSMYPLPSKFACLRVLDTFSRRFGGMLGFSDHTEGFIAAATAVGLGATIFEKHITLDKQSEGPDHSYAMEPQEFTEYVNGVHEAYSSLGDGEKDLLDTERKTGRRDGLFASRDLVVGERLSEDDFISARPAIGLRARYSASLLGAKVKINVSKDAPLTWDVLSFDG